MTGSLALKSIIETFVVEHYTFFGLYPMDVEVHNRIYSWEEYWEILGGSLTKDEQYKGKK